MKVKIGWYLRILSEKIDRHENLELSYSYHFLQSDFILYSAFFMGENNPFMKILENWK